MITIGDHIRNKRLSLELTQEKVAEILHVTTDSITGWEKNRSNPQIQFMPAIINFLEYLPIKIDKNSISGKTKAIRLFKGMSQKKLGKLLNIDPSTIDNLENGRHRPSVKVRNIINGYFNNLNKKLLK